MMNIFVAALSFLSGVILFVTNSLLGSFSVQMRIIILLGLVIIFILIGLIGWGFIYIRNQLTNHIPTEFRKVNQKIDDTAKELNHKMDQNHKEILKIMIDFSKQNNKSKKE